MFTSYLLQVVVQHLRVRLVRHHGHERGSVGRWRPHVASLATGRQQRVKRRRRTRVETCLLVKRLKIQGD